MMGTICCGVSCCLIGLFEIPQMHPHLYLYLYLVRMAPCSDGDCWRSKCREFLSGVCSNPLGWKNKREGPHRLP